MRKIITILAPLFIFATVTAKANEVGMGVTGALHMFDGSGTETTRQSSQKNTGSHSDEVLVPEIFVESISDQVLDSVNAFGSKSPNDLSDDVMSTS